MPREQSLSIYACFSGKKRTSMFISRQRCDHFYIQTRHNNLFFSLQSFSRKPKEKLAQKARLDTERVNQTVLMPPGYLIRLLESN